MNLLCSGWAFYISHSQEDFYFFLLINWTVWNQVLVGGRWKKTLKFLLHDGGFRWHYRREFMVPNLCPKFLVSGGGRNSTYPNHFVPFIVVFATGTVPGARSYGLWKCIIVRWEGDLVHK